MDADASGGDEVVVMTDGEPFTAPCCMEEVSPHEMFTVAPSGTWGVMVVRCASCSPRLLRDLA
jgi:hypothetical protein